MESIELFFTAMGYLYSNPSAYPPLCRWPIQIHSGWEFNGNHDEEEDDDDYWNPLLDPYEQIEFLPCEASRGEGVGYECNMKTI